LEIALKCRWNTLKHVDVWNFRLFPVEFYACSLSSYKVISFDNIFTSKFKLKPHSSCKSTDCRVLYFHTQGPKYSVCVVNHVQFEKPGNSVWIKLKVICSKRPFIIFSLKVCVSMDSRTSLAILKEDKNIHPKLIIHEKDGVSKFLSKSYGYCLLVGPVTFK